MATVHYLTLPTSIGSDGASIGLYDTQYTVRSEPDCRGRLRTDKDGRYGYRAVVPVPYPVPGDVSLSCNQAIILIDISYVAQGPVGDLLLLMHRHNMRPAHLHIMIEAAGFHKLTTALYPSGDMYLSSDSVFGVKKSLIVVCCYVPFMVTART
jgi:protocatechuate 3,4-dioxygenase beta subunit